MTGLAYHPHEHVAATTSSDGGLRLWERQAPRESGGGKGGAAAAGGAAQGATWRCLSSSAYQGEPRIPAVDSRPSYLELHVGMLPERRVKATAMNATFGIGAGTMRICSEKPYVNWRLKVAGFCFASQGRP